MSIDIYQPTESINDDQNYDNVSEIAIELAKTTSGTWMEGILHAPRAQRWGALRAAQTCGEVVDKKVTIPQP